MFEQDCQIYEGISFLVYKTLQDTFHCWYDFCDFVPKLLCFLSDMKASE